MKHIVLLTIVLATLLISCTKKGVYTDLTKNQISSVKKSSVLASYSLNNYYLKYIKNERLGFLRNQVSMQIGSFDTLYMTEIISLPVVSIKGFLWSDNEVFIEYSFRNVNEIAYDMINRKGLILRNGYYEYLMDEKFLRVRNEIKNSSTICDGEIVVLIKCIKENSNYIFDSVIFESYVLYGN